MDRDLGTGLHVDPLGDLEVQRALALARARENYPAVPRETLLGYCEAAWDVTLKADPRGRDLQGSFDRALLIIAWTQRRSGGRVPLRELIDQTVPRIALEPFIAEPPVREPAPEVGIQPEAAPSRRSPLRLPFSSPIPVGAAVAAAGVVGVGVLSQAEVIPIAPLQPAGSDEAVSDDDIATRDSGARGSQQAASGGGTQDSADLVAGLVPEAAGDAAAEAFAAPAAPAADRSASAAAAAKGSGDDEPASAGRVRDAVAVQVPAETAGAQAAPPAPAAPVPAPAPPPQPVVRVEMAPTAMILEVSAPPQRPPARADDDEDADLAPDVDPVDPLSDEPEEPRGERRHSRDDEDDEGPLDVLEDLSRDDDEDGDESESPPDSAEPVTPPVSDELEAQEEPVPVPPAPAPEAPAPAPVPVEPAPAPAPVETTPAAPAPAPSAPPPAPAPTTPPAPPA